MLTFRLLGPVDARTRNGVVPLGGVKPRTLLAALLLEHGNMVSASRLVDVIWAAEPPPTARALIQTYVSSLRRTFAHHGYCQVIVTLGSGYVLRLDPHELDRDRFEAKIKLGRKHAAVGRLPEAVEELRQALDLWRGPALSGLEHSLLTGEARRLDELRMVATEERVELELALGTIDHLPAELSALLARHPTNERLRAQHMLALYRMSRQADALECYRQGRDLLLDELGLEPGVQLQELHQAILRGDSSLDGPQPRPAKTRQSSGSPAQLPLAPVDFTGRHVEVTGLTQVMSGPLPVATQVITGQAGAGKSTLAAQAAHNVAPLYPDGQLFAELRGTSGNPAEPSEVLARFLRALGVEPADVPQSAEERGELYRTLLAHRKVLVLLDDAHSEAQVRPLLPGSPTCAVVVSSRDRLSGLAGAALTELSVLSHDDAQALLIRLVGAERVDSDIESARQLLEHCGNLPLAIRIAAARLTTRRQLPLRALAQRLADERQRLNELAAGDLGVRASIALSYNGLDPQARRALRRTGYLAVPGFTPSLVGWLLDAPEPQAEAVVERLVDAQLVEFTGIDQLGCLRYRLHDLVRLFARERAELEESLDDLRCSAARALGGWLTLIDHVAVVTPPAEIPWQRTSTYHGDVPAAVVDAVLADPQHWFDLEQPAMVASLEVAATLGLCEIATEFASARRHIEFEGANRFAFQARVIDAALTSSRSAQNLRGEAVMLTEQARLRFDQDNFAEARQFFGEALSLFRELRDEQGQAACVTGMGLACRESGRLAESIHFLNQATGLIPLLGDDIIAGYTYRLRASALLEQGHFEATQADLAEAVAAYRRAGSRRGVAYTMRTVGLYHRALGQYDQALAACRESAAEFGDLGDHLMHAYAIRALAKTEIRCRDGQTDIPRLQAALEVSHDASDTWGEAATLRTLGESHLAAGRLELAEADFNQAMRIWDTIDVPLWRARTMRDLAALHRRRGRHDEAELALHRALKIFHDHGAREFHELSGRHIDTDQKVRGSVRLPSTSLGR